MLSPTPRSAPAALRIRGAKHHKKTSKTHQIPSGAVAITTAGGGGRLASERIEADRIISFAQAAVKKIS
jgi:hypothetical protein